MKYALRLPFFLLMLFCRTINAQEKKVQHAFDLNEIPAIIEGMAYDSIGGNFYFGESVHFRILRYSRDGKSAGYIDAAKDGMTSVLGMSVSKPDHQLWVCGAITVEGKKTQCLFQYNLKDGKLVNRFPDTSGKAQLFNDVAITTNGGVYITDTYTKSLYTIDKTTKVATLYLQSDSLKDSNGITADGNTLYVSTSRGFARINTIDKTLTLTNLKDFIIAGNDGLYFYNNSLIGIQNVFFPITIGRYFLDSTGKNIRNAVVLAADDPLFVIPSTGAIVDDNFYFMANTNIGNEELLKSEKGSKNKLKKVSLAKIPLTKKVL